MKPNTTQGIFKNFILGGDEFSLEERIFNGLTFFSFLAWALIFLGNLLFQYEPLLLAGNIFFVLIHSIFYYCSRFLHWTEKLHFPFAVYTFLALAFLWLTSGGIDGGAIFIFNMLLSIFIVIIKRRSVIFLLLFSGFLVLSLIFLEYKFPDLVTKHGKIEDRLFDLGISILVSMFVINLLIYITIRNYVNTNQVLDETLTKIRKDLLLSRKIQTGIISQKLSENSTFSCYVRYIPLSEVGGDIYSIEESKDGNIQIFLADATGHGIQGALITMLILSEYNHCKALVKTPSQILKMLNDTIATKYRNLDIYFSAIMVEVKNNEKKLIYSSAGHIEQFLLKKKGEIYSLVSTGNLLGFQTKSKFQECILEFEEEDILFLFTDGIVDEFKTLGEEFGLERLKQRILNSNNKTTEEIIEDCIQEVKNFLSDDKFQDDITFIGIKKKQSQIGANI